MARGKPRHRRTGARQGCHADEHRSGRHSTRILQHLTGILCALLVATLSATTSAQDEGVAEPAPIPGAPTEAREEDEALLEERRIQPFSRPEPSLTERLLPDARPDLSTSVLFPPNALTGVRRPTGLLQVGNFLISPSVQVSAAYDDNVSASDGDREDDVTGNLGASVSAESLFERHSLGFGLNASIGNPHRNVDHNATDRLALTSSADGRLDLTPRSSLTAEARVTRGAQSPEAQEAGAEDEPTIFNASGAVGYEHQFNRLAWQIAGAVTRTEADDGEEAAEQDRTGYTISPGLDYEVSRRLSVFAGSGYSRNEYDTAGEGGSRDSQAVRADVGADLELGRNFGARIGVGYVAVFFADSERETQQSPAVSADLNGAISLDRLTLLSLGLNHSTDLTTADEAALVTRTQFATAINRLLTRSSAILASVTLSRSDFIDESRTDHDVVAQLAYSHELFRNIALNLGYRFSQRFSDDGEDEFYRNLVSVGLSASF